MTKGKTCNKIDTIPRNKKGKIKMKYVSTRNNQVHTTAAGAIAQGISSEGGLFVPSDLPKFTKEDFLALAELDYCDRAKTVLTPFLNDFTAEEIDKCVKGAYVGTFDDEQPAKLVSVHENLNVLELWHGPTCAFKDLALQLLPFLLTTSAKKVSGGKKIVILVATSGDTGKAALEGFCDVEGTEIIVFYPSNGVSPMQKLQMDTQKGDNVHVYAIKGNFDDAQTGVKKLFTNPEMLQKLDENGYQFSSANSINWGRLAPQIVYYVSSYCDLLAKGTEIPEGGFNIVVPTGNFGNILAAYYAKQMGVPVHKLICASNSNCVLTDFINTGKYDRNRPFFTTISPSMDILISSNLERMLYALSDGNDKLVAGLQKDLAEQGTFTLNEDMKNRLSDLFYGGFCSDEDTQKTIQKYFGENGYLCDTHTAVALNVYEQYVANTGDDRVTVVASTASPYKFAHSVLPAVSDETPSGEFEAVRLLSSKTDTKIPAPIVALESAQVRFKNICEKEEMQNAVFSSLNIQ